MSITLDLPDELEKELSAEAERLDLSLSEYILQLLATAQPRKNMPSSGSELVRFWQNEGLIGTQHGITDSAEHARELRRKAEERVRE